MGNINTLINKASDLLPIHIRFNQQFKATELTPPVFRDGSQLSGISPLLTSPFFDHPQPDFGFFQHPIIIDTNQK